MEDTTITLTETELQSRIDDAVSKATTELTSKHNGEMASMRKKYDADLEKEKQKLSLSVEEKAKLEVEEKNKAIETELNDLRAYKKSTELGKRLQKEGLPSYFVNDQRLLSAEEGELDKVIKVVKSEYDASKPQGNAHSSVVQVGGKAPASAETSREKAFEDLGRAIEQAIK